MSEGPRVAVAVLDQVLADLSSVFAEAVVDEPRLLDAIVQKVADNTGDACVIRLLDDAGAFLAAAVYHSDPKFRVEIQKVARTTAPDPHVGVWRTLLHDRAPVRMAITPSTLPDGMTGAQVDLLAHMPVTHFLGIPLVARGRVIGGILVVRCQRPEAHTDADVRLVREVGARAALAIDNARLWAAERAARLRAETAEVALRQELAERQRAEERLRESEEQLRLLFHHVLDYAMVLLDAEGRVVSWNAGAERMTGWPAAEAVGRAAVLLFGPADGPLEARVESVLDQVRREGRAEFSSSARRRGGEPYEMHAVITAVRAEHEELRGFAVVMRDVTLIREARMLREANALLETRTRELAAANQELEAFAYSVSHDLRAPLRAVDGFSEAVLVDHGEQLDPVGRALLQRVRAAAARMQQLIDDMLTLSRSTRGSMERGKVDLARIAAEVAADLQSREPQRHVELTLPEKAVVLGDARLLHIVMENLLGNAWKFTRGRDPATVSVQCEPDGQGVRITVRDNGAGFEQSQAGRLFQPFQRLHRADEFEGTGIGLAIVRRIANRHGGRAWAEGQPDVGAAVHVWLPTEASLLAPA